MSKSLRQQLAQKIVIDLRNFAEPGHAIAPVTQLSTTLGSFLRSQQLGGVILFAENCQSPQQLRRLTEQLQQTSEDQPILISIDQEGGRVVRTGRNWSTAFAGNMALGAAEQGEDFAYASAKAMGEELNALGVNVVHAPCVDINNNPANPVINIRSYGDKPSQVTKLASAACRGFNEAGVVPTLKHFPGHGDTAVDSHTGLPIVTHPKEQLAQVELAVYRSLLNEVDAPLVMTGHVQYPALDSTTVVGEVRPATMSRAVITDLLRGEFGYQGVVITDAMDMAAIAKLLPPEEAVAEVFAAGVDIALMPVKVRSVEDFTKVIQLLDFLERAVTDGRFCRREVETSVERIEALKKQLLPQPSKPLSVVGCKAHQTLESELALAAITEIGGCRPLQATTDKRWLLLFPGKAILNAVTQSLASVGVTNVIAIDVTTTVLDVVTLENADLVLAGFVSPRQSAAELGGVDDLRLLDEQALINAHQPQRLQRSLAVARQCAKPIIYVSLRTPYDATLFGETADWVLATYAYHSDGPQSCGASYTALAEVLVGNANAKGQLPVTLP